MPDRLRHLPLAWAVVLAVLLLGPALGPGYVLSYDLVWVPHLALRSDFVGLGTALPRAVPSDAVVAVLDTVVPGVLLEKVALLVPLVAAAAGTCRLVGESLTARLVAVTLTVWNPFVAERLVLGHWTVLVGYGVLPWLVLAGRRARASGRLPTTAWLLMALGSLSATAGVVSAVALLVSGWRRGPQGRRPGLTMIGCVLATNAPWLVAGLLHADSATGPGASVFALHPEGSLPAPLAALGLGGIWNAEVVPVSRTTFLSWLGLAVLLALAAIGARAWARSQAGEVGRLLALWGIGLGLACLTWLLPGATDWLAAHVPGGGLLRDGSRALALCLPVYAGLPAAGAEILAERTAQGDVAIRRLVAGTCAVLPIVLLYDAAWGVAGALRPVAYPASWGVAAAGTHLDRGDLLVLPFSAYRAPAWNHHHTVLDPLGRYLPADYVADDVLVVSGTNIPGEDPRVRQARRALSLPTARARTRALLRIGLGYVAVEHDVPGAREPRLVTRTLTKAPDLRVSRLVGRVHIRSHALVDVVAMSIAWAAYVAAVLVGAAGALAGPAQRVRRRLRQAPHRAVC